jgi:hypothetical protein
MIDMALDEMINNDTLESIVSLAASDIGSGSYVPLKADLLT